MGTLRVALHVDERDFIEDVGGLLGLVFSERPGEWWVQTDGGASYSVLGIPGGYQLSWKLDVENNTFQKESRFAGYYDDIGGYLRKQLEKLGWQVSE